MTSNASRKRVTKKKPHSQDDDEKQIITDSRDTSPQVSTNQQTAEDKARISKRWILVSVVSTLVFCWFFIPYWVDTRVVPFELARMREMFFETAISKFIPESFRDEFIGNLTNVIGPFWSSEFEVEGSPGKIMRDKGARAKHPIVIIPGATSTGLELWEGKPCSQPYFRQRFWGSLSMPRLMFLDKSCWREHLVLDPMSGGDPEGIKLRAAQGLEAADYWIPGYWVWGRMIENLAEIGYDSSNLYMAANDWRLDTFQQENRDNFYTRLKMQIEFFVKTKGQKVVIATHSFGAVLWLFFMKWVECEADSPTLKVGKGGKDWVAKHIHAIINVGGPLLGAPKAYPCFISGEMGETATLNRFESAVLELLMSKKERLHLFRSWPSGFALMPKGGNIIWGNGQEKGNADSPPDGPRTYPLVRINDEDPASRGYKKDYYADDMVELLERFLPKPFMDIFKKSFGDLGIASPDDIGKNDDNPATWSNPLACRLPNAPEMTIYSFYGVNKTTERAYEYHFAPRPDDLSEEEIAEGIRSQSFDKIVLDIVLKDSEVEPVDLDHFAKGVHRVDGDGTIPLISSAYMGAHAWRKYSYLNPAKVAMVNREYDHNPTTIIKDLRGGPRSSDHVDILGNHQMTIDILRIASGFEVDEVSDQFVSRIKEMADKIDFPYPDA